MINLEWVKDYIDISDQDLHELAVKITKAGINIEAVMTNKINNLVIGEIIECEDHPDSDHLHICKVNIGSGIEQIVCGAPNARRGIKVIVALPGAVLPGNFEIKKSKIRGIESNGMLCALYELGLEEKTEESYNKGIEELNVDAPVGLDPIKYLNLEQTLYELDIHKHRNNDCYYHIGFAYEISAILNRKVKMPEITYTEIEDNINNYFNLEVKTNKCSYYLAKMVTDVEIKESPEFIKKRLLSVGMRPINNVVDISNYVMLEYGQPLHFFDKDKLGNKVIVRDANDNETITTLDNKERILNKDDIVIANNETSVCIAGVMGGLNTEVDENTKNILIESAIFAPTSIRYTASNLNLKSEASIRYGKGLNYEYTEQALNRALHLLEKYANAKVLSGIVKHDIIDKTEKIVKFTPKQINKMLGIEISKSDMEVELNRLDFKYEINGDEFIVTIPKRRLDIDPNINDIAEEIGRLYGYHNLVSTLPKTNIKKGEYIGDVKYRKTASKRLRSLGLNETKTYTLVSKEMSEMFRYEEKENVILPNPMSGDKSVVRTTLIPSLLKVYDYNKARKINDIMLYEISKTYDVNYKEESKIAILMKGNYITNKWQNNTVKTDFYLIKGIVENILDYMGFKNRYQFIVKETPNMHPGISARILLDKEEIGIIGRVHPNTHKDEIYVSEISLTKLMKTIKPIKFKESSKYPEIKKDLAFIINKDITSIEIENEIKRSGGRLLTNIEVFDLYTGENVSDNEKSIAYNLTFQSQDKTLTDDEVMNVFNNIIKSVETKLNVKLRNN